MTQEIPKPAEIRKTHGYFWRRLFSKWPFIVWLAVAFFTYSLWKKGVTFERMNGVVEAETETIVALSDGVIKSMTVNEIGDVVEAGQEIFNLDDRLALAELENIKRTAAFEKIDNERKFSTLKTDIETAIDKIELEQAQDSKQLELLQSSVEPLRKLVAQNLRNGSDLEEMEMEISKLKGRIPLYDGQLTKLGKSLDKMTEITDDLKEFSEGENVEEKIHAELIKRMKVASTNGGIVSQIYLRPGSVVEAGQPIVEIINTKLRRARGFILEKNANEINVGDTVYISLSGGDEQKYYVGKIQFISPEISSVPDSVPGRMIKGRVITCTFDQTDIEFLPGASVTIHLTKPGKLKPFTKGNPKSGTASK